MDAELESLLGSALTMAQGSEKKKEEEEEAERERKASVPSGPATPKSPPPPPPSSQQQQQQQTQTTDDKEKNKKEAVATTSSKSNRDRESRKRSSSRHRSKSRHHHHHHSSSRSSHHRHHRHRSRSRSHGHSRSRSRSPSAKRPRRQERRASQRAVTTPAGAQREKERNEDRSKRIVFAYSIPVNATMDEMYKFFGRAGRVRDIRLISDRHTKRSKGMGYIEYESEVSVSKALGLSGQTLNSLPVIIMIPSNTNNGARQQQQQQQQQGGGGGGPDNGNGGNGYDNGNGSGGAAARIYVGNLSQGVTAEDLHELFGVFGEVVDVAMPVNIAMKRSCGYAFVQYKDPAAATMAITQANLVELAGYPMRLGYVLDTQQAQAIDFERQQAIQFQQMQMQMAQQMQQPIPQQPYGYPYKTANGMLGELDNDGNTTTTTTNTTNNNNTHTYINFSLFLTCFFFLKRGLGLQSTHHLV